MNAQQIRPETLKPGHLWTQPTANEVREMIRRTNLSGSQVASFLGLAVQRTAKGSGSRTVRRWVSGDLPMPYAAWCLLAHKAGFGLIWE